MGELSSYGFSRKLLEGGRGRGWPAGSRTGLSLSIPRLGKGERMQGKRLRTGIIVLFALVPLLLSALPASGHSAAFAAAFIGTAGTSGTWLPKSANNVCGTSGALQKCPAENTWSFVSQTDATGHGGGAPATGTGRISGFGSFTGWCGRSTGTGVVSVLGHQDLNISWQSAGTFLVLTDTGAAGGRTVSIVNARANGTTTAPVRVACLHFAATSFTVVGIVNVGNLVA